MKKVKESFFWTSYSDLMTSLFFVMLVLFVLVIIVLHNKMSSTEMELEQIKEIANSTKDLSKEYFQYDDNYKKYILKLKVKFEKGDHDIDKLIKSDSQVEKSLEDAGKEISRFLQSHSKQKYLLIIEGQASRDSNNYNYQLSYERALALFDFWVKRGIRMGDNCEVLISGSGDGKLPTNSMRDSDNSSNQRFLIHILPKNILQEENEK